MATLEIVCSQIIQKSFWILWKCVTVATFVANNILNKKLTITIWGIWWRRFTSQKLSPTQKFVFYHRSFLVQQSPQHPGVVLQYKIVTKLMILGSRTMGSASFQWWFCDFLVNPSLGYGEGAENSINHYWKQILWQDGSWQWIHYILTRKELGIEFLRTES